jgi:prepilin-type N-terminal cleavage/methylation domain-containing protein
MRSEAGATALLPSLSRRAPRRAVRRQVQRGLTLIELAIGLVVIAVIIGGLLIPLQAQVEQARFGQTQRQLEEVREALIGFAIANGRLPCPATLTSNGVESPAGGGHCTAPWTGLLPAVTLGLTQVDAQGYALDAWGLPQNRIRYAVTSQPIHGRLVTEPDGLRLIARASSTGLQDLADGATLFVCSSALGITPTQCGPGRQVARRLLAVIYSLGPNASAGGGASDEAENLGLTANGFVSRTRSGPGSPAGEFDDIVTWLAPPLLISRMVAAGRLP